MTFPTLVGAVLGLVASPAIDVRLVSEDRHFPVTATLVAIAAVASPVVSLFVARYVTSRTLSNDQRQRALDRNQEWQKQLQDRQLTSSADFAHAAFQSLIALERLHPTYGSPTTSRLRDSRHLLEAARQEMPKVQVLFRAGKALSASEAVQTLVDLLDTAQTRLEAAGEVGTPTGKAEAQAEYAAAAEEARPAYQNFLNVVAVVLAEPDAGE